MAAAQLQTDARRDGLSYRRLGRGSERLFPPSRLSTSGAAGAPSSAGALLLPASVRQNRKQQLVARLGLGSEFFYPLTNSPIPAGRTAAQALAPSSFLKLPDLEISSNFTKCAHPGVSRVVI